MCSRWPLVLRWRRGFRESTAEDAVLLGLAALSLREAWGFLAIRTSVAGRLLGLQFVLALLAITVLLRTNVRRTWFDRLAVLFGVIRHLIAGAVLDRLPSDFEEAGLPVLATAMAWLAVATGSVLLLKETERWWSTSWTSRIATSEE